MIKTEAFQLKADFMPLTVFKFFTPELEEFKAQLRDVANKAPKYFVHAPVLLDVQELDDQASLDLDAVCQTLRTYKVFPIGIKGLAPELHSMATERGLAIVKPSAKKKDAAANLSKGKTTPSRRKTKVITTPILSGTQVYAQNGDLIILSTVNAGAEVIADGNIHVYGALRGRALAGARGDETARIFCKSLEAELISIAGCYLVKENLRVPAKATAMTQVYLEDEHINIEGI